MTKKIYGLSFIILAALISTQCTKSKKSDTFVYCSEGSPSIFNPQLATDGTSFNASERALYNHLVKFKPGSTEIAPELAETWEVSENGLEYTFNLRKGVKFHTTPYFTPTRDFNADDVVFSFDRQMNKNNPYHLVNGGSYQYYKSMDMEKIIKSVNKLDDYTVKFVLSQPEAPFIANLAMGFASILSKEYADKMLKAKTPEKVDVEPIGTGPFVFKSYLKDNNIRYTSHPQYFEGEVAIKKLVFAITTDPSVRFQKLKKGECQFIAEPSPTDVEAMKANSDIKVLEQAGLNVGYLAFNVEKKPLDNLKVRKAIYHALNRDSYIEAIYLGNAQVAKNPIPPTMWSYNKDIEDYKYDLELAKKLLKEAGYGKGFAIELWTLPVSRPYNPNGKKMGELMQADLAKVGIRVKLVTYDWPTYLDKTRKGEHQLAQLGWTGDNGDPDNFLNVLLSCAAVTGGGNVSRWCNKEFDKHILKGKTNSDVNVRTEAYVKAQEVFHKQLPWVPIAHSTVYRAMRSDVKGYYMSPFGSDYFDTVSFGQK